MKRMCLIFLFISTTAAAAPYFAGSIDLKLYNNTNDMIAIHGVADTSQSFWIYRTDRDWDEQLKSTWVTNNMLSSRYSCLSRYTQIATAKGELNLNFANGDSVVVNMQYSYDCNRGIIGDPIINMTPTNSRCTITVGRITPGSMGGALPITLRCG